MHLLYVDESGLAEDSRQRHFVLAGVAVPERVPHWIERDMDLIAARFSPDEPQNVELHGSPMRTGHGRWRHFPREMREQAILDALELCVQKRFPRHARLFAVVLERANYAGQDIAQVAFEQISSRFDQFLGRLHRLGDTQRGLMVFDKCNTERRLQSLAREFKHKGHTYGVTRNMADVPVFVDSEASRLVQLADFVAYAIFRHYEYNDSKLYTVISECFDSEGGVKHGLYKG